MIKRVIKDGVGEGKGAIVLLIGGLQEYKRS